MEKINISVPRLNPNDDELLVVDILITKGQKVNKGQKLCIFETTKTAVDFESEFNGIITKILIEKDKYYSVGKVAFEISTTEKNKQIIENNELSDKKSPESNNQDISLKAQKILKDNNLDVKDLNLSKKTIFAEDVINFLNLNLKIKKNAKNVLIGTGMHSRLIADILMNENLEIDGFISQKSSEIGKNITKNLKVISSDETISKDLQIKNYNFYIGVGGPDNNLDRIKVFKFYQELKSNMPCLISSRAYVSKNSKIGDGSVILPGANIGPNVVIGKNCIINSNAVVCHDTIVEDHAYNQMPQLLGIVNRTIFYNRYVCVSIFSVEIGENCLIYTLQLYKIYKMEKLLIRKIK